MAGVLDTAKHILHEGGPMTAMKLQKLCYYSQAWSLVWDEKPLFSSPIQAWANGPVIPRLYSEHRGKFTVRDRDIRGDRRTLTGKQKETIDAVLEYYGDKSSQWLSELTHNETPWKGARTGLEPGERGEIEITRAAMAEYYGSL